MHNFELLKELGRIDKPIFLKRGLCATLQEFLMSAEYIMAEGNQKVILCERGIRTFETATRNTLDLSAVAMLHEMTHLPVVVDPSQCFGYRKTCKADVLCGCRLRRRRPYDRGSQRPCKGSLRWSSGSSSGGIRRGNERR